MRIGSIDLGDRPVVLAPMEDVSDPPFRILCNRYGAAAVYTEFISAGGLVYGAEGSHMKLDIYEEERPVAIQVFGGEVEQVRQAMAFVNEARPDFVDINFGCPVKKVVCKDGGAGILRNLPKMAEITKAVVASTDLPVTVKTRLGWNDETIQILDVAKMLEDCGIQALTVHARTRSQMYTGKARWEWLRRIKQESGIHIPLIGNGDADSPERIDAMFEETGVDAVMIGRAAIGNPWIFRDHQRYRATGVVPEPPRWEERLSVVAEHVMLKCAWLGETKGILEMRRMYGGYFKGFRGASVLRQRLMEHKTKDGVLECLLNFREDEPERIIQVPAQERAAQMSRQVQNALAATLPTRATREVGVS